MVMLLARVGQLGQVIGRLRKGTIKRQAVSTVIGTSSCSMGINYAAGLHFDGVHVGFSFVKNN
jgi:hypothetical protein